MPLSEATLARYVNERQTFGTRGFDGLCYRCEQLFHRVGDIRGKSILEIGGGEGHFLQWCLARGARRCVNVEPVGDGSFDNAADRFRQHRTALGASPDELEFVEQTFQEYDSAGEQFDVVLLYSSINHLDEPACMRLLSDGAARTVYVGLFRKMHDLLRPGGVLIIQDAARENYWNWIGRKSPWSPTIEWDKHQEPETWSGLLAEAGFRGARHEWLWLKRLEWLGPLAGTRLLARLTLSQFVLSATR